MQASQMLRIFRVTFCGLISVIYSQFVLADKVDELIQSAHVSTYNCPDDKFTPFVDEYLKQKNVTAEQLIKLKVHKAHWLICVGKYTEAEFMLQKLLSDSLINNKSQIYAAVHYQLGFIYDVLEKPEKCTFYQKAEHLAKNKFNDIYLSSQLGFITACGKNGEDVGVKFGRLFALLKLYTELDDQEALAHIHNNIGLLYSSIGQRALAAEQHQKSYEIGLNVYEEKNQLAPLMSIITAYTGSGDYVNAKLMIEELGRRNLKVNTPLTNSWYHYAQSRQAYRTNDFESLRKSLRSLEVFLKQISDQTLQKLYEWYVVALCLHDQDKLCVEEFMQNQNDTSSAMPAKLSKSIHYTAFLVKAHLFLNDVEAAKISFDNYTSITLKKMQNQQASARVLGVAKLHNEIIGLETSLAKADEQRIQIVVVVITTILGMFALVYITFGRSYLRKLATDPLTGLSNENSVVAKIKKVKAPINQKVNTLALFEVSNFNIINARYGHKTGEMALKQVAKCLKRVTRDKDILGRVGSNQFIVGLVNIEDMVAKELVSRIQKALNNERVQVSSEENVDLTCNMHVYSSLTSLSDADEVLTEIRNVLFKV